MSARPIALGVYAEHEATLASIVSPNGRPHFLTRCPAWWSSCVAPTLVPRKAP